MKARQLLCLLCASAILLPVAANAEIYKWKDRNGTVRYSDTPPPGNVKPSTIGKTGTARSTPNVAPVEKDEAVAPSDVSKAPDSETALEKKVKAEKQLEKEVNAEDEAARVRAENAELEKKKQQVRDAQAKQKIENCASARANHQSYVQGGRIYKTNENGEREYLSDGDLKAGINKTQAEINEYCN